MKLLTLNIRYGGGKRAERLSDYLTNSGADIIVLTEFAEVTHTPSSMIMVGLSHAGYEHQVYSPSTQWEADGVLLVSKIPFEVIMIERGIVHCRLIKHDIHIMGSFLRWAPENEKDNRKKRKDHGWSLLLDFAGDHCDREALIIGDLNSNLSEDHETGAAYNERELVKLKDELQWTDPWERHHSPVENGERFTHIDIDGWWVRSDICFCSQGLLLKWNISSAYHDHSTRNKGATAPLTNHSALIVDLTANQA